MNNYEQELIDELLEAEQEFNIDPRAIQEFRRESRQVKQKKKNINKKTSKVKIEIEEKE